MLFITKSKHGLLMTAGQQRVIVDRKVDASWLARCTGDAPAAPTTIATPHIDPIKRPLENGNNESNSESNERRKVSSEEPVDDDMFEDDVLTATPQKKRQEVPKLLTSVSTPTNFKGLFSRADKGKLCILDFIYSIS